MNSILKTGAYILFLCAGISCNLVIVNNDHAWEEQGPGPLRNGQTEGLENNPIIGAVSSILPDPDDADIIILGAVNGGIWRTENGTSNDPHWVPLGDTLPSLAISCMHRDRTNHDILYAGTGDKSSSQSSGPSRGIFKSIDRGDTWTSITGDLNGQTINQIVTGLYNPNDDANGTIYAATSSGLFVAVDGTTFTKVDSVPGTSISDVYCDEKGTMVIVAIPGDSVMISFDSGLTFSRINVDCTNANNVKLGVVSNRLFVAQSRPPSTEAFIHKVDLANLTDIVFFPGPATSEDFWLTRLGPFTTPVQSFNHFSFLVTPHDTNHIDLFLGGVSNTKLFLGNTGQSNYSGRIFHGIFTTLNSNLVWSPIVGNGANNTAPHADSRILALDAEDQLLEGDDGGIYKLTSPFLSGSDRKWHSQNGDLRISEVLSVSYDARNNALLAALQDNGCVEQTVSVFSDDEKIWTVADLWTLFGAGFHAVGDGFQVNVDNQHDPPIRYTMLNNMENVYKREYSEITPWYVGAPWDHFFFNNGCVISNCALHPDDQNDITTQFARRIPFELNRVDQKKFVMGGLAIYKFDNRGDDLRIIDTANRKLTLNVAYGATDMTEVVYHLSNRDSVINQQITSDAAWKRMIFKQDMRDVAIEVDSGNNIFVITGDSVFNIRNFSGDSIIEDFTLNLPRIVKLKGQLSVISTFKVDVENESDRQVVVVGGLGAVYILTPYKQSFRWVTLGTGLANAPVSEVRYFREDDLLVVSTVGRGVWVMKEFRGKVPGLRSSLN